MEIVTLDTLTKHISCRIWTDIECAYHTGQGIYETTITDRIWETLFKNMENSVAAKKLDKPEKESGADIEWWLWDNSRCLGIALRIQAKKINKQGSAYPKLKYEVLNESQANILIRSSKCDKVIPLYCFYNYIEDSESTPLNGWEYAFAHHVQHLELTRSKQEFVKRKTLKPFLFPMYQLFSESNVIDQIINMYKMVDVSIRTEELYKRTLPEYVMRMLKHRDYKFQKKFRIKKGQVFIPSHQYRRKSSILQKVNLAYEFLQDPRRTIKRCKYFFSTRLKYYNVVEFPANAPEVKYLIYTEI